MEEFVLVVLTFWPITLGVLATLKVMTGVTKSSSLDAEGDEEAGSNIGVVATRVHDNVEKSTVSMQTSIHKVEQQISDLQVRQPPGNTRTALCGFAIEMSRGYACRPVRAVRYRRSEFGVEERGRASTC